jgi:hypothetical protein
VALLGTHAFGHKPSFPARSKISPQRSCEGQVYGDESGPLVGSSRPIEVDPGRQLAGSST